MRVVKPHEWTGTKQDLLARVDAFKAAKQAHAFTVGEPAPLEEPIVEELAGHDPKDVVLAAELSVEVVDDEIEQARLDRLEAERYVLDKLIAAEATQRDAPESVQRAAAAMAKDRA